MSDFSKNHFELFGLPVGFVIDSTELASRYRDLQNVVHPDRYAAAGDASRRLSLQRATWVNEAYETLRQPLSRARYLLELAGRAPDPTHKTIDDPEFLVEQMELREALAEVRMDDDPLAALDRTVDHIDTLFGNLTAELAVWLEQGDATALERAASNVQKMQFLDKLRTEAEAIEADLEGID